MAFRIILGQRRILAAIRRMHMLRKSVCVRTLRGRSVSQANPALMESLDAALARLGRLRAPALALVEHLTQGLAVLGMRFGSFR